MRRNQQTRLGLQLTPRPTSVSTPGIGSTSLTDDHLTEQASAWFYKPNLGSNSVDRDEDGRMSLVTEFARAMRAGHECFLAKENSRWAVTYLREKMNGSLSRANSENAGRSILLSEPHHGRKRKIASMIECSLSSPARGKPLSGASASERLRHVS